MCVEKQSEIFEIGTPPELSGVYIIFHRTGVYIGSTRNYQQRRKVHISTLKLGKHQCHALQEAFNDDPSIAFEFVQIVPERIFEEESSLLGFYRSKGVNVFNRGGNDAQFPTLGVSRSEDLRARIRESVRELGYKHTDEARAKIGAAAANRTVTAEHREKLRQSLTGFVHSDEFKAKISAATRGRVLSSETKAKLSAAAVAHRRANSRPVLIDGVKYLGIWDAADRLGLTKKTVETRIYSRSESFKNWNWAE
ncbi:NUMOD3 motif (2 copies) [Caballeronia arationis]|uniref:NUMOD3 domain-containing DNA-binding protein n=1 Tax=Caballeronia arationis TaxID=1777142 RepID=UPI00074B54FD|nr:NUMOD3 domain-containing DNA-binding protein [Caballeronia arationis]SAL03516.1 NUMOD3 motif (2 copies) [Caballeronia arationis]